MLKQILLTHHHNHRLSMVLEEGNLTQLFVENTNNPALVGNVYLGVVVRVLSDSKMAFVDIGEARTALLHFYDCHKVPVQGEKLLVQVIKSPIKDKGARLSTNIRLMSEHLVYLPTQKNSVNVSKKIQDPKIRQQLSSMLQNQLKGGVIVRTSAQFCVDFESEIHGLAQAWQAIIDQKQVIHAKKQPKCLYHAPPLYLQVVMENQEHDCQVVVDDEELFRSIAEQFANLNMVNDDMLYQNFAVAKLLEQALDAKVALPSGGFLVIDEVEAMTVIDVNAGTSNQPLKSNFEAVDAIAHALRLKNIGGIVVIDFIDMPKSAHSDLIHRLNQALKNDPVSTKVYQFSQLGLLEMTRERIYPSLKESLKESFG